MKRVFILASLIVALGAAPASALTQSNTAVVRIRPSVTVANTGFNFSLGGPITTGNAYAINFRPVVIIQVNSN